MNSPMNPPVPVVICTYTRLAHLRQTIDALLNNALAGITRVFVFSDAASAGDEEAVGQLRAYLSGVSGFGRLTVVARERNLGMVGNCIGGLEEVLASYGRSIFMEDDIVTAPGFLTYMNQAMNLYQSDARIFSVSGYCPPLHMPGSYGHDAFFLRRFNAWGCGIWQDRHVTVREVTPQDYDKLAADRKSVRDFAAGGGRDMLAMLKQVADGRLEAYDVQCMYTQFKRDQYSVYPVESLVKNIGLDGSGVHSPVTRRFDVELSQKMQFRLPERLLVDEKLVRLHRQFRNGGSLPGRIAGKLQGMLKLRLTRS